MTRITIDDSPYGAICALAEGNPGALTVCAKMAASNHSIDPQAAMGGMHPLIFLDHFEIYGPRIWMLYKDVCGQDLTVALAMLRSTQIGLTPIEALNYTIDNSVRVDGLKLVKDVQEKLSGFAKGYGEEK